MGCDFIVEGLVDGDHTSIEITCRVNPKPRNCVIIYNSNQELGVKSGQVFAMAALFRKPMRCYRASSLGLTSGSGRIMRCGGG
jgi:hypothetical protein